MPEAPAAREIVLKKFKPMAPPFHQHIARAKLRGTLVQVGDRVVVYEVVRTAPDGQVQVAEDTVVKFE